MKIRWLEYFSAVAAEGSITHAAWKLDTSQAALSRVIRDLEDSLGLRLFQRTGRGMVLTAEGAEVLQRAELVIEEYAGLLEVVAGFNEQNLGDLTLHVPLRVGRLLTKPFYDRFEAQFPKASAQIFESLSTEIQARLCSNEIDAGIYYSPVTVGKIHGEKIATERLYVIGAPEVLGHSNAPIPMKDAIKLPYLMQSPPSTYRTFLERFFHSEGHSLNVVRNLNTIDSHIELARSGEGVTLLAYSAVHREVETGALVARRIVNPDIPRDIFIATASQSASFLQREAISMLKAVARENKDILRWDFSI